MEENKIEDNGKPLTLDDYLKDTPEDNEFRKDIELADSYRHKLEQKEALPLISKLFTKWCFRHPFWFLFLYFIWLTIDKDYSGFELQKANHWIFNYINILAEYTIMKQNEYTPGVN